MDRKKVLAELDDVFAELETLLKNPEVEAALAEGGVIISLAIVAADGLKAYVHGDKVKALEELETVTEEVRSRMRRAKEHLS